MKTPKKEARLDLGWVWATLTLTRRKRKSGDKEWWSLA